MRLTNELTLERYGKTLEEWRALTKGQKSGIRGMHHKTNRTKCECGNVATVRRTHGAICERCAKLEAYRGKRFDGHSNGETCGVRDGYDPFTVNL